MRARSPRIRLRSTFIRTIIAAADHGRRVPMATLALAAGFGHGQYLSNLLHDPRGVP